MQFNVAQLLMEPTGAVRRYALAEDLTTLDPELLFLGPLVGEVTLLRTNSGVLATGRFDVTVQMDCGRCIEPIPVAVEALFEESFRPLTEVTTGRYLLPDEFEGEEEDLEDAALIIDEHHILDIGEVLRQSIWLGMPMIPRCSYARAEDCPRFVERLSGMDETDSAPEDDTASAIDPRWAALLALRAKDAEEVSG